MAKYSIQDTTLTAIGDAIRNKTGEHTRVEYVYNKPLMEVVKSPNAIDFDSYEGPLPAYDGAYRVEINIPEAKKIKLKIAWKFPGSTHFITIFNANDSSFLARYEGDPGAHVTKIEYKEDIFDINNLIFSVVHSSTAKYSFFYAEFYALDEDGNEILVDSDIPREVIVPNTLTPAQMATEIEGLPIYEPPAEAFVLTGDCQSLFKNHWDWFLKDFGDKITTTELTNIQMMFDSYSGDEIPFDINIANKCSGISQTFIRAKIKSAPYIKGDLVIPTGAYSNNPSIDELFSNCHYLRYIPDDYFDKFGGDAFWEAQAAYTANRDSMFNSCYSLRKIPTSWRKIINKSTSSYGTIYNSCVGYCSSLDEIIDIPILDSVEYTSNLFNGAFLHLNRAKNITFETNDDGTPKVVQWKGQSIDLSSYIGYPQLDSRILNYNSGITPDKAVSDDESYQALKDDPDWYAWGVGSVAQHYSRYNHDSAVATINSLPDTSAYLAEKGGTNIIKFRGVNGSKTDGGAINTLTEEEIAVAAAKGWTVTLV